MSRFDEHDLIGKFISALTVFSERSAALEARVLSELGGMRNDINQLKQTVLNENAVSVPQVMEQQRMTMIELIRQIQPLLAIQHPIQYAPIQPPTIAVAPTQQSAHGPKHFQPLTNIVPVQPQPNQATQPQTNQATHPQTNQATQPQTNQASQPSSGFGSEFTLKEGEWYCPGCYVKNEAGESVCLCCQTSKAGTAKSSVQSQPMFKPQSFTSGQTNLFSSPVSEPIQSVVQKPVKDEKTPVKFSFTPNKPFASPIPASTLFGSGSQKAPEQKDQPQASFSFIPNVSKTSSTTTTTVVPQENKPFIGANAVTASVNPKPLFGGGIGSTGMSFESLASGGSFLNKNASNASTFTVDPKQFAVFGGGKGTSTAVAKKKGGNEEEDDGADKDETEPEEFVPDESQFKRPDIALPDLVEVKTGEEGEEVLFSARCRLYRFLPGVETKERGTGELKLLKNSETGKVRCVMRREQVLKLCANFVIPPGFTVSNTQRGENVLTWACRDYSNTETPEGENMTLICRFKDVDAAKKFKDIVQSVTV